MIGVEPLQIWKGFHWSFFINIQGLIICLRRFEMYIADNHLAQAQIELETATDMMIASSAAMELAGSFTKEEYKHLVRTTMMPPEVQSKNFSGLMCWEHASLIQVWKRLRPVFGALPVELQPQHDKFIAAYLDLIAAHRGVCEKFGGDEEGSLRFGKNQAVNTLDKISQSRLQLIDPERSKIKNCPFSFTTQSN